MRAMNAMLDTPAYQRMEHAIAYIDTHGHRRPSLAEMADAAGLSPARFSRSFKRWCGLSPHQFLQVLTLDRATEKLSSASVMSTALETGLSGPSRLHDLFVTVQAMSPGQWSSGGEGLEIRFGSSPSPFGTCLLAWTHRGLCQLVFTGNIF